MGCLSCPRRCNAERPLRFTPGCARPGFCASPLEPVVARAALHFWEEPVISGTRGSGTVFFSGCNLHCVYCQNYGISSVCAGKNVSVERLRAIYRELADQGAHNINLVTPSHYAEAILDSLTPSPPLPVVWNSNGYDRVETLRKFDGKIQIYLPDLKYADNALAGKYSGAPDYFETAADAIREMFRQIGPYRLGADGVLECGVVIRHLVLPGCAANTLNVIRWVAENFRPGDVLFSLMRQYLPCGQVSATRFPELNRKVSYREYTLVKKALMNSGIEDGFLQGGAAAGKEFIPPFDGTGVEEADDQLKSK